MNIRKFLCKSFGHWRWLYDLCDCKRYKPPVVPVNVCSKCWKIAVAGCYAAGKKTEVNFLEGYEPTEKCLPSKCCQIPAPPPKPKPTPVWKPKKPELKKRLKYLEIDFLGWFVDDFLPTAWNDLEQAKKNMYAVLKRMTDELEGDYPAAWSGFLVLSSGQTGHAHCNRKLPWRIKDGRMDWFAFNPKWWRIYGAFIDMLNLFKIEHKPQAMMAGQYNSWLYRNNINGITDPWSGRAVTAQSHFIKELLRRSKWIKFINEPKLRAVFPGDNKATLHGGDHVIADWHRDMFHKVEDSIDLRHLIVDVSMRECAFAQLIEFSKNQRTCPKCGIEWDNPPWGVIGCCGMKSTVLPVLKAWRVEKGIGLA